MLADGGEWSRLQGRKPSFSVCDELHVMSADVWDALTLAGGTRSAPLTLGISTECDDDDQNLTARLVEHGRFVEWSAPPDCAVDDRLAWAAANPQIGDTARPRPVMSSRAGIDRVRPCPPVCTRCTFTATILTARSGAIMSTDTDMRQTSRSLVEEYDAIREVVQTCLDGEAQGDAGKLQEVFHPDARMFGDLAGTRYDVPIQTLFDMVAEGPADTGNYQSRILSITHLGDVATATAAEEGYWGTVSFVDFFSLCRIDGAWKIVNKTFAHVGGEPPA
ncbi:MAG: nuclear transport factor 2 family protein [Geodermatophilaceae bacterium]